MRCLFCSFHVLFDLLKLLLYTTQRHLLGWDLNVADWTRAMVLWLVCCWVYVRVIVHCILVFLTYPGGVSFTAKFCPVWFYRELALVILTCASHGQTLLWIFFAVGCNSPYHWRIMLLLLFFTCRVCSVFHKALGHDRRLRFALSGLIIFVQESSFGR